MTDYQDVRTTTHEQGQEQGAATFRATQIIWLLLSLLEAAIALRVMFKLFGVNAANPFATLLYSVTHLFVAPFTSLTGAPAAGGMILEISSVIAMIVYLLIAWGIERTVNVLFYHPRGSISVRQTTVTEHTPLQAPIDNSQTITSDRMTTQPLVVARKTTVTESTNTQTPGSL